MVWDTGYSNVVLVNRIESTAVTCLNDKMAVRLDNWNSLIFYYPQVLGHSDNYFDANPLMTPNHIVPE